MYCCLLLINKLNIFSNIFNFYSNSNIIIIYKLFLPTFFLFMLISFIISLFLIILIIIYVFFSSVISMMLLIIILTCNKKLYFAIIINKILIFHCFTCLYFNQNKKIKIIINIKRNYTFSISLI